MEKSRDISQTSVEDEKEKQRREEKFRQMTEDPVESLICRLAMPTIASMLVTALYNLIDTIYVGHLDNTQSTAAVGVAFSLMSIIQAVGFFFGHGSGNAMSRALGRKDYEEASIFASTGFFSALVGGVIFGIVGSLFLSKLSLLLGATEGVLPYCNQYIRWILIGSPFMVTALVLNNQLRLQGNAFFGMMGIMTGAILNVILDPIFIFGLKLGVQGAAIATVLSQFISFWVLLLVSNKKGIPIRISSFRGKWSYYKEISRSGFPSLCRQAVGSFASIVFNRTAGIYGDTALAAFTIVNRTTFMVNAALVGFGHGFQPVCGFNYGAKRYDRVKKAFFFCVKVSTAMLAIFAVLLFLLAPQIVGLFGQTETRTLDIAIAALRFQCLTFPALGVITITQMMLQNMGKTAGASVLSAGRQGLFLMPVLLILSATAGLLGVELSQTAADLIALGISVPYAWKVLDELK